MLISRRLFVPRFKSHARCRSDIPHKPVPLELQASQRTTLTARVEKKFTDLWLKFRTKLPGVLHTASTDPTPTTAAIAQLGALSTALSFAASDVLMLRVLAILGTLCFNLIPNYVRDNWVSMGWGMIYLSFNAVRAVEIVRDRTSTTESLGFTEDEMSVYASKFHKHMPPRRFQALLKLAEWREVDSGTAALNCQSECGLLVRGRCSVSKHGETLLVVNEGMFLAVPHLEDSVDHHDSTEGVLEKANGNLTSAASTTSEASTRASLHDSASNFSQASVNIDASVGKEVPIIPDGVKVITTPATSQTLSEMAISIAQKGAGFESTFRIGNPPKNAAVAGSTNSKDMGNPTTAAGSPAASASIATTAITSTGKVAASDQMATVTSLEPSLVLVWP